MGHSHARTRRAPDARYVAWGLVFAALGGAAFQVVNGLAALGEPSAATLTIELRQLIGRSLLFLGLVVLDLLIRTSAAGSPAVRTTRIVLCVQCFQVLEHVALALTFFCLGRPAGISTLFGLVEPGPALWTYQAWWNLTVNLAATLLLLRAARQLWREGPGVLDTVLGRLRQVDVTSAVAATVRLICGLAAVILISDVVFVVFNANPGNSLVALFRGLADDLVLFFRDLFLLGNSKTSTAVNYGLAATAYFLIGQAATSLSRRRREFSR